MSDRYRPGPLSTDMGTPEPLLLDVTARGIAVVTDGKLLGYVSADELRAVVKQADEHVYDIVDGDLLLHLRTGTVLTANGDGDLSSAYRVPPKLAQTIAQVVCP